MTKQTDIDICFWDCKLRIFVYCAPFLLNNTCLLQATEVEIQFSTLKTTKAFCKENMLFEYISHELWSEKAEQKSTKILKPVNKKWLSKNQKAFGLIEKKQYLSKADAALQILIAAFTLRNQMR